MFKMGDQVIIVQGDMLGMNAIVLNPSYPEEHYYQIAVETSDGNAVHNVHESFIADRLSGISSRIPYDQLSVEILKYLSEDQMKDITARVYENRITKFVDDVLERRTSPYGGIVDQILMATVERYVTKLADTFENDFLAKAKECIELKDPGNDEHTTFQEQLTYKLSNAADKYINANLPKIHDIMSSTIQDAATKLQVSDISAKIAKKIDLTKMISEIILEQSSI